MANKERYQNPVVGDEIRLRMFTYNSNNFTEVVNIEKVEIFFLDPDCKTDANPDGRRLVEEFDGSVVSNPSTGEYILDVQTRDVEYNIGRYIDVWHVEFLENEPIQKVENCFDIYPNLFYTTPIPVVYDFKFHFQPNKFRKGSKQYIIIDVVPNVPTAGDLQRYYENLAIVSDLKISIEQTCGDCVPDDPDLRLIVDDEQIDYREKRRGYYQLDTEDLDCGIYDIWFKLEFGGNVYISDRNNFQIFD